MPKPHIPGQPLDIRGDVYGRLTVLSLHHQGRDGRTYWLCACSCGNLCVKRGSHIRRDIGTQCASCGYRHNSDRHKAAQMSVAPERRSQIAKLAAAASAAKRMQT